MQQLFDFISNSAKFTPVMRRTREQIRKDNRPKSVEKYILGNKFLREPKHYKNNYWSWAAWDSWAAQGKAGGCGCCSEGSYNGTLKNKRAKTYKGKTYHGQIRPPEKYPIDVSRNLCSDCIYEIHKQIGVEFKKH